MRIIYICHARFPTQKAYGKQIAEVGSALQKLGHEVTLVCPGVFNDIPEPADRYYAVAPAFTVTPLRHFDASIRRWIPGMLRFYVTLIYYRRALRAYLREHPSDLLYARSPLVLAPLLRSGMPVILELHTLPRWGRRRFVSLCRRSALVVCLTKPMRDVLVSWGMDPARVTVEGDGVDLDRFRNFPSGPEARARWYFVSDRPVVGYIGSLVTQNTIEKGIPELLAAFRLLKEKGIRFHGWIVGGPEQWRRRYEAEAQALGLREGDVRFEGQIAAADVPSALAACDVCVYPAPASSHPYFQRDTSPLKLFEYLAADRRIVCADLPPLRDAVEEDSVIFCKPGDVVSLTKAIECALREDPSQKSRERRDLAERYSWEKRMERIIEATVRSAPSLPQ